MKENIINLKNQYMIGLYIYQVCDNKNISNLFLKSGETVDLNINKTKKLIFSYRKINFVENTSNCIFKCTNKNQDNTINRNMDYIFELFDIDNSEIKNRFINKVAINNIYNNECIMCYEIKPDSINYFQCLSCKNKFLCEDCFKQLQSNDRLNNKCLLCYQNYII